MHFMAGLADDLVLKNPLFPPIVAYLARHTRRDHIHRMVEKRFGPLTVFSGDIDHKVFINNMVVFFNCLCLQPGGQFGGMAIFTHGGVVIISPQEHPADRPLFSFFGPGFNIGHMTGAAVYLPLFV